MSNRRPRAPLVAFFSANPSCLTTLDLQGEIQAIVDELDDAGLEGMLQFESQSATTPKTVQRALLVERPTVVQFSGHGRGRRSSPPRRRGRTSRDLVPDHPPGDSTGILLHGDRDAAVKVVSGRALGDLFAKVGSTVRLVVLNACHSVEQLDAIARHVDFVIGIEGAILDEAAKAFAVALYRALALGRTIEEAFGLGVNALMLEDFHEGEARPVLRSRRGADPATTALVAAPPVEDGKAWDVFIAYAPTDESTVRRLAEALHDRHLRVFLRAWEIGPGGVPRRRLEQGLEGSTHGLLAISPTTMSQPWVQEKYTALFEKVTREDRLLIPVLIGRGQAKIPPFLWGRELVDLRGRSPEDYQEQVGAIARALRGLPPGPPSRLRRRGRAGG